MVVPSRQDNLPNTAVESLACGTPVVAFDVGGLSDIVDHHENGYLARPFDPADLAAGISWVLSDDDRHQALSVAARDKALRCFSIADCVKRYIEIYQEVLGSGKSNVRA